jgi:hypothetical protein
MSKLQAGREEACSSAIFACTACEVASALPVGESWTPMAALGWPFKRVEKL